MKKYTSYISVVLIAMMFLSACTNDIDSFDEAKGKPIEFDFNLGIEENGITRSSALSTNLTVYLTADKGTNWYAYTYDSTNQLWKPQSGDGIKWSSKTMTIYAAVRFDGQAITNSSFSVQADQSTKQNMEKSDFLGAREQVTYTTGKTLLTLKHRVAKLVVTVQVNDASKINYLTGCETVDKQITKSTFSCGDMNVELTAPKNSDETEVAGDTTIKLFREGTGGKVYDTSLDKNKTVSFYAYLIPITGNITTNLKFTYSNGTTTKTGTTTVTYNLGSGITLDAGCETCYTVYMSLP